MLIKNWTLSCIPAAPPPTHLVFEIESHCITWFAWKKLSSCQRSSTSDLWGAGYFSEVVSRVVAFFEAGAINVRSDLDEFPWGKVAGYSIFVTGLLCSVTLPAGFGLGTFPLLRLSTMTNTANGRKIFALQFQKDESFMAGAQGSGQKRWQLEEETRSSHFHRQIQGRESGLTLLILNPTPVI